MRVEYNSEKPHNMSANPPGTLFIYGMELLQGKPENNFAIYHCLLRHTFLIKT